MTAIEEPQRRKKVPRGKARLELQPNGQDLAVQLDRPGFRRLLQTLERLAETGEDQTFEKSGRNRLRSKKADGAAGSDLRKLIFRIENGN